MSMTKKIWIIVGVIVLIIVGVLVASFGIAEDKSSVKNEAVVKKTVKKMIMKCGQGKCGVAMMEEVEVEAK